MNTKRFVLIITAVIVIALLVGVGVTWLVDYNATRQKNKLKEEIKELRIDPRAIGKAFGKIKREFKEGVEEGKIN